MSITSRCLLASAGALAIQLATTTAGAAPPVDVLASGDLGDELGARPRALGVFSDGSMIVGGTEPGGHGAIVRLDAAGLSAGPTLDFAGRVHDLAVDPRTGQVAVLSDRTLLVLGPDLAPVFELPIAREGAVAPGRVAVGERGTIAVVTGGVLQVVSSDGVVWGTAAVGSGTTAAVAVPDAAGIVVVIGWDDRCGSGTEAAFVRAFDRRGAPRWREYEDCGDEPLTDSRGIDVAVGGDGHVYVLAEVEGVGGVFAGREVAAFDATTDLEDEAPLRSAYYARLSPSGEHLLGQWFAIPDSDAIVTPVAIAADRDGNVAIAGLTTHTFEGDGDDVYAEALGAPTGFFQIVGPDLDARRVFSLMEVEGAPLLPSSMALAPTQALVLAHARTASGEVPMVVALPTEPDAAEKRPDREDVGTFGYESGIAGSDPTCHACGPTRAPGPFGVAMLGVFVVMAGRRRRPVRPLEPHREPEARTLPRQLRRDAHLDA
jgi:hypothetical protein